MKMNLIVISKAWFEILSELFVNLAAGWLALVFIEPHLEPVRSPWLLLFRLFLGILTLTIAKRFREEARKYD